MDINTIPKALLEQRQRLECNFIFCLYKDPFLIPDYQHIRNTEDIITEDGMFYYGLAQGLYNAGYQTFDNMTILSFLDGKKTTRQTFEELGGYANMQEILNLINVDNFESYYEELVKNNLLIRLNAAGFPVLDKLDMFDEMSSTQIYDYYDYQLNSLSLDKAEKAKIENLSSDYDTWLKQSDESKNVGFKVGSGMMDYQLAGIHRGNLTLLGAGIGQGKTSSAIPLFILTAVETGNDITILCNEQNSTDYRNMIICSVLFQKLSGVKGLNRASIIRGHFNDDQKRYIKQAIEWLEKQPGKIKFIEMNDYNVNNVKKVIKKQAKCGCAYFFFDVLKNESDASDKAWGVLADTAKALFLLAKHEDVAILATVQLAPDCMNRKYLDLSAIGKSRAISECAATVMLFRHIQNNEIDKIKPWKWKKDPDGKNTKIRETIDLDPMKHYILMFIPKNRFGSTITQIVLEFNQDFNTITDVGYYIASYDDFTRK